MNTALKRAPSEKACSNITEVVMTNEDDGLSMLLPMLAHLSRESKNKWLTWIAPKSVASRLSKKVLESYGFALKQIRIIHPEDNDAALWLLWDALANGTSANVVANMRSLSENDRIKLETACQRGNSRGLILRSRE